MGTAEAGSSGRPLQFLAITDLAPHQRLPTSPPQNYSLIRRSTWLPSAYLINCSMAKSVTASDCYDAMRDVGIGRSGVRVSLEQELAFHCDYMRRSLYVYPGAFSCLFTL